MAQIGYTPLLIYSSNTTSNVPSAGNLTNSTLGSELAINITDGKLFYKDNSNNVQVIAWKTTPTSAGGTGLTSYSAGDMVYYATGTTFTKLTIGSSGNYLSSSGTAPQWSAPAALTKTDDTNVTLTLGGSASTALLNAASLTLGWTGQLSVARGGTGNTTGAATAVTSNATTGVMQIVGPGAGTTRVMTIPNANFTAARTDAAQTFTGTQTFSSDVSINGLTIGKGGNSVSTNTAVGVDALLSNGTGGLQNTAVGFSALKDNTSGDQNTAVGTYALYQNTTGLQNTAVGYQALQAANSSNNTAFGWFALQSTSSGGSNTAIGMSAGESVSTGASNVLIGRLAGKDTVGLTTGSNNVIVGTFSRTSAVGSANQYVFGYNLGGKGDNTAYIGGTNGAYNEKNVTTWETTSDRRLKKNIVDNNEGLEKIAAIRVRNFEYRLPEEIEEDLTESDAIKKLGIQLGVIAQELQEVCPNCVSEQTTGALSVNTDEIFWHMVNAIKQLKQEVENLKVQIGI